MYLILIIIKYDQYNLNLHLFYEDNLFFHKKKMKITYLRIRNMFRAFTSHYLKNLYFTSSKCYFSIFANYFYNLSHIPLFILQYILLKYNKIILFLYIFFNTTDSSASTHHAGSTTNRSTHPRQQQTHTLTRQHHQ